MKRLVVISVFLLSTGATYSAQEPILGETVAASTLEAMLKTAQASCDAVSNQSMDLHAFETAATNFSRLLSQPEAASTFLICLRKQNPGLAETLMLHQQHLQQPAEIEAAFLHYVINAKEPLLAEEDPEIVRRLAGSYRKALLFKGGSDSVIGQDWTLHDLQRFGQEDVNKSRYGRADVIPTGLLKFDESAKKYSRLNAVWMAEMSALAYWDPELINKQLRQWEYERIAEITDESTETSAYLAEKDNHQVLSFRGTSSLKNFRAGVKNLTTDAQIAKTEADWAVGKIHSGFVGALDAVWPQIKKNLGMPGQQQKKLWVTGHSLGAALAQLATLRLNQAGYRVRAVYTFGTPRIGDAKFVADYDRLVGPQTFPHINVHDMVTRVPPASPPFSFRTTARKQIWHFTDSGHAISLLSKTPDGLKEASVWGDAIKSILRTTSFLPESLRPKSLSPTDDIAPPTIFYSAEFKGGPLDEHGSFQYLFKLACVVVEKDLWPIEEKQASVN